MGSRFSSLNVNPVQTLIFSIAVVLILSKLVVTEPKLDVKGFIEKVNETNTSCFFMYNASVGCEKALVRVVVLHSGWAAIFDKSFLINDPSFRIFIQLPVRNYTYTLRSFVYCNGLYGIDKQKLTC